MRPAIERPTRGPLAGVRSPGFRRLVIGLSLSLAPIAGLGCGGSSSTSPSGTGGGAGTSTEVGTGGSTPATGGGVGLGGAPASGGASGGTVSAGASGGAGGTSSGAGGSATQTGEGGSGGGAGGGAQGLAFAASRLVVTGVRGVTSAPATAQISFMNETSTTADLTSLSFAPAQAVSPALTPTTQDAQLSSITGNPKLFEVSSPTQFPVNVAANGSSMVSVQLPTNASGLPAAPPQDSGATVVSSVLTAATSSGAAPITVFGVVLTQALWEPTLGQILYTLGYKLNVGMAQNNANPNRGKTPQQLPGVEAGTDEVAAQLFVKSGTAAVTLTPVARFSPVGPLPFGWYASGSSGTRHDVGTMAQITDPQTSDKSRMVGPPLQSGSATTFDPGAQTFGVWVYTDQLSHHYDKSTTTTTNGDYAYSQDSLNSPANVHRFKAYPLKDATGTVVAGSFLLAVEEAENGDYQDYVFVLGNAKIAP
jgi:hypothetical protein